MIRYIICIIFFGAFNLSIGQFNFDFSDSISVKFGTDTLGFAWSGGVNYAQFSEIDFDFDGDMDLFLFDRSSDNIRLFEHKINGTSHYREERKQAKQLFPDDLRYRVALLDYNGDQKEDIFTYGIGGVKVYKNVGSAQTGLSWELASDLLYSDYYGDLFNLYVSSSDIPAYVDLDFDNDVDVLTFNVAGDLVEYHQNQSQELYGHSDSLVFVLKNACWGKFSEDAITSQIELNSTLTPCTTGNVPNPEIKPTEIVDKKHQLRHSGSTILALDYDDSGVYDLVLGDVNSGNLALLLNGGETPNSNSAIVSMDLNFPSNTTPANVSIFPASFYLDVDFDNVKDLLVCPNAKNISQNEKSVYFYKNLGTNSLPIFSFRSKNFLQGDMLDAGLGSFPIFVDQNGDGLEDLVIGNFYRYKEVLDKESVLYLFRNTGTNQTPFLDFVESDFLDLGLQSLGLRTVPTFGDVDSDGDNDMFLGLENGLLVFYENVAGANNPLAFSSPVNFYGDINGNPISAQAFAFPQLFDLNADGLLDLVLGKKTGEVLYYENHGTANAPEFELVNDTLGGIDLASTTPDGYTAPHFFRNNDTTYLILGAFDGKLHFYKGIDGNLVEGTNFELISDAYLNIDMERYSAFWVNDLDNDGNLDLFVGGDLGGIYHLEHSTNGTLGISDKKISKKIKVFPNPAEKFVEVYAEGTNEIQLIDVMGKIVYSGKLQDECVISVESFAKGIYLLKITNGTSAACEKIIVR